MILIFRNILKYFRFYGGRYTCIVCSRPVRNFFRFSTELERQAKAHDFRFDFQQVETLNFWQCNCPFCLSSDRERLYLIYLEKYFSGEKKQYSILDFAPAKYFSDYLRAKSFVSYVSCDLFREDVDMKVDACAMSTVATESFDIVIFSHVLEHVEYPQKALNEIYRVLKKKGFAIIMVPLFFGVHETVEDPRHTSPEDRCKYYGQDDHVRLYSKKDFLSQIINSGFDIEEITIDQLNKKSVQENAIALNSVLYVCKKNDE